MIPYKTFKYRKKKFYSSIWNFVWSTICIVGSIVILLLLIKLLAPWFKQLNNTVSTGL